MNEWPRRYKLVALRSIRCALAKIILVLKVFLIPENRPFYNLNNDKPPEGAAVADSKSYSECLLNEEISEVRRACRGLLWCIGESCVSCTELWQAELFPEYLPIHGRKTLLQIVLLLQIGRGNSV